jgi:predicted nucleotidyltransferase
MRRISESRFREELARVLAGLRRYRPQKVILLGSFARGDYHATSDIDLLIIKETERPFTDRIGDVLALCDYSIWTASLFPG